MKRQAQIVPLASEVSFLSGGTPRMSESRFWGGDIPWVSSGEMTESRISFTERRVTEEGARNSTKIVPANTVLVVVRGMSLAKEFRISISEREVTFNQDIKALKPSKKNRSLVSLLLFKISKACYSRFCHGRFAWH